MSFTTRILKYFEMSWPSLTQIKAWGKRSAAFNNFDVESFAGCSIASATNDQGQVVAYVPIQTVFLVSGFIVNPSTSPEDAHLAGDALDAAIAYAAQQQGISKMLIVVPKDYPGTPQDDFKEVKMFERHIPQRATQVFGCNTGSSVAYLS